MNEQRPESKRNISPARRVAYAGLITALSVVLLYLLYVLPTLRLSLLFVLSFLPVMLAYEKLYADAALCFTASALLSLLLFPITGWWLLYTAFFGWYSIVREFAVTKWNRIVSFIALFILFNAAFLSIYLLAYRMLIDLDIFKTWKGTSLVVLIIPAAEAAFVLFEVLFGMCRAYYIQRIRKLLFTSI